MPCGEGGAVARPPFEMITPTNVPSISRRAAIPATIGFRRDQSQRRTGGETGLA